MRTATRRCRSPPRLRTTNSSSSYLAPSLSFKYLLLAGDPDHLKNTNRAFFAPYRFATKNTKKHETHETAYCFFFSCFRTSFSFCLRRLWPVVFLFRAFGAFRGFRGFRGYPTICGIGTPYTSVSRVSRPLYLYVSFL